MYITTDSAPKFTIKSVMMIILYIIVITMFVVWYFKGNKYKAENKALKNNISLIQKERDLLAKERDSLRFNYSELSKKNDELYKEYAIADAHTVKLQQQLTISLNSLSKITTSMNITNKNINDLILHPVKREGDDLIKSLDKINN